MPNLLYGPAPVELYSYWAPTSSRGEVQQLKPTQKTMVREKRTSRAVYGICNQISRESTLLAFIVVSARSGEPTNHHNPFLRLQISRRVICIPINITGIIEHDGFLGLPPRTHRAQEWDGSVGKTVSVTQKPCRRRSTLKRVLIIVIVGLQRLGACVHDVLNPAVSSDRATASLHRPQRKGEEKRAGELVAHRRCGAI